MIPIPGFKKTVLLLMVVFSLFTVSAVWSDALLKAAVEEEKQQTNIYKAYFPDQKTAYKAAISYHNQLLETQYEKGYLIFELQPEELTDLSRFGFKFEEAKDFIIRRNARLDKVQSIIQSRKSLVEAKAANQPLSQAQETLLAGVPGYSCYETVEETFTAAQSLVSAYPGLAEWVDVGDSWEKKEQLGGHDIYVLKLTNKNVSGEKPVLFINSAIHAREYTTAPLNLAFAKWLANGYGSNADATWILDFHEVHLMLHTNPDGRKKAETGLSWRKNTNQAYCGATSNSRGVDLNRNFTFQWNSVAGGSSGSQCNSTYRGPTPASEPELQAIEAYIRSIYPDRRGPGLNDPAPSDTSGIHIDIHSYSQLVLWPWGSTSQPAPNGTALQTLGRKFAYFNNYMPQQSVGLYPTDGTSDGISYGELGVAAYTFELGTSFFQSCNTYENSIKPDNLQALIYAAKVVKAPYITPAGPDIVNPQLSNSEVAPGTPVILSAIATDTRFSSRNGNESTQNVQAAEYYIDKAPWEDGAVALPLQAVDGTYNAKIENVTATLDTAALTLGKHIIYLRTKDSTGVWGAVSAIYLIISDNPPPPPADDELENGIAKNNLSGSRGEEQHFKMIVPAGASNLSFQISGGTGDGDLYVLYGDKPTQSRYDCRPYRYGNNETCRIDNIQAGTYYVMVRAYSDYSSVSLIGSFDP